MVAVFMMNMTTENIGKVGNLTKMMQHHHQSKTKSCIGLMNRNIKVRYVSVCSRRHGIASKEEVRPAQSSVAHEPPKLLQVSGEAPNRSSATRPAVEPADPFGDFTTSRVQAQAPLAGIGFASTPAPAPALAPAPSSGEDLYS